MSHESKQPSSSHPRHSKARKSKTNLENIPPTTNSSVTLWNALSQSVPHLSLRYPDNQVFKFFSMTIIPAVLATSNVGTSHFERAFTASDIAQFSSFAAIFDQYMITMVEAWMVPKNPSTPSGAAVDKGRCYSVIDYDDNNALASASAAMAYENCIVCPTQMGIYRKFQPHIAVAAYSGTFSSYQNLSPRWIDCTSTGVNHYGVKYITDQADAAVDETVYDLYVRLHYSFRNVR
jgi:hypothetical protein